MNTHIVVCNAGPLIVLSKLGRLDLLLKLYGRIQFPLSVYRETVVDGIGKGYENASTLKLFLDEHNWEPSHPTASHLPQVLSDAELDPGEIDTLALALQLGADLVLMDEKLGRSIAQMLDLKVNGSLGILIAAYRQSLITSENLQTYFDVISKRSDIWISSKLIMQIQKLLFKD